MIQLEFCKFARSDLLHIKMMKTLNANRVSARKASRSTTVKVQATSRVDKCNKNEVMVSPSILSANFAKLGEEVRN